MGFTREPETNLPHFGRWMRGSPRGSYPKGVPPIKPLGLLLYYNVRRLPNVAEILEKGNGAETTPEQIPFPIPIFKPLWKVVSPFYFPADGSFII